jgi:hypothetical protein
MIKKSKVFAVYGAQVVAYGVYVAVKHLLNRTPECFIVSDPDVNPCKIDAIPVRTLASVATDTLIIIGVTELLQSEIVDILREKGYANTFKLIQREEYLLMREYFASIGKFPMLESPAGDAPADIAIYEVKNRRDKSLISRPQLKAYERAIQAGAAIADERIAAILDSTGVNISCKNKQYCEMTATYWVWKNTKHDWVGIEHYRRHLLVSPKMLSGDIDAVLPLPYICYPNTIAQFGRFVSETVIAALLCALQTLHPNEYESYLQILYRPYQYTYNLVCAKRAVFDAYCAWLFNITEYMETLADKAPEIANTRALSYAAEALTNLYFMSKQDQLKIRHAEKAIYT